jgi:phosphoketolase
MFNQHAKWLSICNELSWRRKIASLNLLITSTVWRQDHNGFTHQDPGFLDVVVNKRAEVTRIYLPPDVNSLLSIADHCLRSENYINVIVSDKQAHLQYLDIDTAITHCTKGISIWGQASNDRGVEPDVVMACAGDIPTQEALAATALLRSEFPDLKIRFINVIDLFKLQSDREHPHGLSDRDFDSLFTLDKPIVFNFHGYPWLIHKLTYNRTNHSNLHVRGYTSAGISTRRWSWRSPMASIVTRSRSRSSITFVNCSQSAPMRRRSLETCRLPAVNMPTDLGSTGRTSSNGDGHLRTEVKNFEDSFSRCGRKHRRMPRTGLISIPHKQGR